MNPDTVAVPWTILLVGIAVGWDVALFPEAAWAANTPPAPDTPIGTVFCQVSSWMTGNLGVALAIIAVSILGILAMLGKLIWSTALLSGVGISIIFGASAILGMASCPNLGFFGAGGLGGPLGISQAVPYLNLLSVGDLAPINAGSTSPIYIGSVPASFKLGSGAVGSLIYSTTGINTTNSPVIGWLQAVYTLPPGYSIAPTFSHQGYGVDSNGNFYIMEGFVDATGDGTYPALQLNYAQLYYNGQPVSTVPSGIVVQYDLYSSFTDYSAGCTENCALTGQVKYTYNTSQGGGRSDEPSSTQASGTITQCTAGTCIAPPL